MIGGIVIVVVLLFVCFLIMIWWDIIWSNCYWKELEEVNKCVEVLLEVCEKLMFVIIYDFKVFLGFIIGYMDLLIGLIMDERQCFYLDNMKSFL